MTSPSSVAHYNIQIEAGGVAELSGPLYSIEAVLLECAKRQQMLPRARIGIAIHKERFKAPDMVEYKGSAVEVRMQLYKQGEL